MLELMNLLMRLLCLGVIITALPILYNLLKELLRD